MAVRIEKTFQVNEPVEKVWLFLRDPRKVGTCVPGAQITEQVDDHTYKGTIKVKVGPSVTDYKGEVQIMRLDEVAHEIEILGKGQDLKGKGSAQMKMTGKLSAVAGGTEVVSVSELTVVGVLAQMGARVINEVSNIMFEQFARNFRQQLQSAATGDAEISAASPKPISAIGVVFAVLISAFKAIGGAFSALKSAFKRHPAGAKGKVDAKKPQDAPAANSK